MVGRMSPTVHLEDGFKFQFWSNEPGEPPHVHVKKGGAQAKWWLDPVSEWRNDGFNPSQRRRIRNILIKHRQSMLERWYEWFGKA
jgi:hypothetical protein